MARSSRVRWIKFRPGIIARLLGAAALSLPLPGLGALECDVLIRNGRVVDGTGAPAFHADVAIRNGTIVWVGRGDFRARATLDAAGLIVAPGFIDVHTHAEDVEELPAAENFLRMGVTTVVLGNCGSSVSDVGALFARLRTNRPSLNVATLIGHGTVRSRAMNGSFDRPPDPAELEAMRAHVERAMRDGALGLSTGLIYLPGTFARTDEIAALAEVAGRFDGIYASHMRDEGLEIRAALEEVFQIAHRRRIRAHVSHLKLSGPAAWGQAAAILKLIEEARARGLDITQDQYAYTASSTTLSQLIPEWARAGKREEFSARLEDPSVKARIVDEMKQRLARRQQENYSYAVIASCKDDPRLNGKSVVEAARLRRSAESLDDQIETVLDIHLRGGASGVFFGINEADLRAFLVHPNTMVASDSGVRRFGEGVPHPRGYGNNARVLGRYAREEGLLRMEDAVRKMTSLPAAAFRLRERGIVAEGYRADLAIFDPAEVIDRATFTEPHQYPAGFRWVFVNGECVVDEGQLTKARPGQPIRRGLPPGP